MISPLRMFTLYTGPRIMLPRAEDSLWSGMIAFGLLSFLYQEFLLFLALTAGCFSHLISFWMPELQPTIHPWMDTWTDPFFQMLATIPGPAFFGFIVIKKIFDLCKLFTSVDWLTAAPAPRWLRHLIWSSQIIVSLAGTIFLIGLHYAPDLMW